MAKTEQSLLTKKELLEIFVKQRVDSPFPGDWESVFRGSGYEFWALRELEPSDPLKNIDWKTTAKTGRFHVREYLAESYCNVMILYDVSKSVAFGRKELVQANIAVSLAYTAALSNNGCGLILFADHVRTYIPPRMGWSHFMQILTAIAQAEPVDCPLTDLDSALNKLVGGLTGSLTFILSDFLYPFESEYNFQRSLHGTNTHEVKAIQVLEEFEAHLPEDSKGLVHLYDYENKARVLLDLDKRQIYNQKMQQRLAEIRHRLQAAGIELLLITPADDFRLKIDEFMCDPVYRR